MTTDNNRQVSVHLLELAGDVGNHRHVGRISTFQGDHVGREVFDLLSQIDARHPEVREAAFRDVGHGSSQVLRAQGLHSNGVVKAGGVATFGLDEEDALDARFEVAPADDIHRRLPPSPLPASQAQRDRLLHSGAESR